MRSTAKGHPPSQCRALGKEEILATANHVGIDLEITRVAKSYYFLMRLVQPYRLGWHRSCISVLQFEPRRSAELAPPFRNNEASADELRRHAARHIG
jgi:hypothetical protein